MNIEEFNCIDCYFQESDENEQKNHITIHLPPVKPTEESNESIKCCNCDKCFENKWNLMNHRRSMIPTKKR